MSKENKIIEDIERLILSNELNKSDADELLNNLADILFSDDSDSKKFGALLRIKIVPKLSFKIKELENKISLIGSSRSKRLEKEKMVTKNNVLSNLIITLFHNYPEYLSSTDEYKIFENNNIQRIDTICNNFINENINETDPFPEYYDKKNADKIIEELKDYYKRIFQTPENISFLKTKLTKLSGSILLKILDIENEIIIREKIEDDYKKQLLTFSSEQQEEKDRIFDLYHGEMAEIMNLFQYKIDLTILYNHIADEYPFINSDPIVITDVSVFGDSNIEAIKYIFNEFSDFIDTTVTNERDFIQAFMGLPISHRIKFINGSLSDYAYFIMGLKEFFLPKYKDDSGVYNQWWSDRFLFSGKIKDKKSISNIISALGKDREASKKNATNNIVSYLKSSYNHHT